MAITILNLFSGSKEFSSKEDIHFGLFKLFDAKLIYYLDLCYFYCFF